MKENLLLKIALVSSLVGLVVLYFASTNAEIKDYQPKTPIENVGDDVKLTGFVGKISSSDKFVSIEINQEVPINIILFTDSGNLSLNKGDRIEVIGKVQEFNGKKEIIAQRVRVIK